MYIIVTRSHNDMADASAEFACRVLARVTGRKMYSNNNSIVMKVPNEEGDSELIRKFYQRYPKFVPNMSKIPDEVEASEFINKELGGVSKIGWRFVTSVIDANMSPQKNRYDLIDKESL